MFLLLHRSPHQRSSIPEPCGTAVTEIADEFIYMIGNDKVGMAVAGSYIQYFTPFMAFITLHYFVPAEFYNMIKSQ
jgi:hypothetical protein